MQHFFKAGLDFGIQRLLEKHLLCFQQHRNKKQLRTTEPKGAKHRGSIEACKVNGKTYILTKADPLQFCPFTFDAHVFRQGLVEGNLEMKKF